MSFAQNGLMCPVCSGPADNVAHKRRWKQAGETESIQRLAIAKERAVSLGELVVDLYIECISVVDPQWVIEKVIGDGRARNVRRGILLIELQNVRASCVNQWIVQWNEIVGVGYVCRRILHDSGWVCGEIEAGRRDLEVRDTLKPVWPWARRVPA